jgi:hypothetical protein
MEHSKISQAIRIYLSVSVTENAALGIYTSGGASEIRLSEEILSGVAESWTSGLIAENGIGEITEGADLRRGGAPADYSGINIDLINTNQFIIALKALGVYLPGCKCELIEFIGTETDCDSVSRTVIFTGIIEDMQWSEINLGIPVKNARYKRNASMSTPLTTGATDIVPITFGALYPEDPEVIDNIAKFVRLANIQDDSIYTNAYFTGTNPEIKIFPVIENVSTSIAEIYRIKIYGSSTIGTSWPADAYVVVVDGDSGVGQIRQVTRFDDDPSSGYLRVTIKDVFYDQLLTGDDNSRSWVQFIKVVRNYNNDNWPCKNFLNASDGTSVSTPEVYSYGDDKFSRIADYGFSVVNTSDNNSLDVDGSQYSDNIDNLNSFLILPIVTISPEDTTDLTKWNSGTKADYTGFTKRAPGVYSSSSHTLVVPTNNWADSSSASDKDFSTYFQHHVEAYFSGVGGEGNYCKVLKFTLPEIPDNLDIKSIGIGINAYSKCDQPYILNMDLKNSMSIVLRRFANTKDSDRILDNLDIGLGERDHIAYPSGAHIDCLPDFYYESNTPSTKNLNFYRVASPEVVLGVNEYPDLTGYKTFQITDCTKNIYNSYLEGAIFLHRQLSLGETSGYDDFNLIELAIILELNESSISKEIYSPASGRIFDNPWYSRKTNGDLIENPVDIIEHLKRLQDWSERCPISFNWGKQYPVNEVTDYALIKTGAGIVGSFDNTALTSAKAFRPAFQIFDKNEAYTDTLVKKLCQTYNLCTRIDEAGYECIYPLTATTPSETILFEHIAGDIGEVQEPQVQDVFCEPVVNYCYNPGADKLEKQLKISNIQAYANGGLWSASSSGFASEANAKSVLDLCATLWGEFKQVEQCPTDFSDQRTITTYADALAYLLLKLDWMGKQRISIPLFYLTYQALSLTQQFFFGQHININLPHQTNGVAVECVVERVTSNKNGNLCKLDLVIL